MEVNKTVGKEPFIKKAYKTDSRKGGSTSRSNNNRAQTNRNPNPRGNPPLSVGPTNYNHWEGSRGGMRVQLAEAGRVARPIDTRLPDNRDGRSRNNNFGPGDINIPGFNANKPRSSNPGRNADLPNRYSKNYNVSMAGGKIKNSTIDGGVGVTLGGGTNLKRNNNSNGGKSVSGSGSGGSYTVINLPSRRRSDGQGLQGAASKVAEGGFSNIISAGEKFFGDWTSTLISVICYAIGLILAAVLFFSKAYLCIFNACACTKKK